MHRSRAFGPALFLPAPPGPRPGPGGAPFTAAIPLPPGQTPAPFSASPRTQPSFRKPEKPASLSLSAQCTWNPLCRKLLPPVITSPVLSPPFRKAGKILTSPQSTRCAGNRLWLQVVATCAPVGGCSACIPQSWKILAPPLPPGPGTAPEQTPWVKIYEF